MAFISLSETRKVLSEDAIVSVIDLYTYDSIEVTLEVLKFLGTYVVLQWSCAIQ